MKYRLTRKYVDFKQLLLYIGLQWKKFLVFFVCSFTVLVLTSAVIQLKDVKKVRSQAKDGYIEKTLSLSETDRAAVQKYIFDRQTFENQHAYDTNALYMQIDPEHKYVEVLRYQISGEEGFDVNEAVTQMANQLKTDEPYQKIAEDTGLMVEAQYIRELVSLDQGNGTLLQISMCAPSDEMADGFSKSMQDYIESTLYPQIKKDRGDYKLELLQSYSQVVRDTQIRDVRANNLNLENNYAASVQLQEENFSKAAKEYVKQYDKLMKKGDTIEIGDPITYYKEADTAFHFETIKGSMKKYAVYAAVISLLILFFRYVYSPYIWSGANVSDSFNLTLLSTVPAGSLSSVVLHKGNKSIWNLHRKLIGIRDLDEIWSDVLRYLLIAPGEKINSLLILSESLGKHEAEIGKLKERAGKITGASITVLSYEQAMKRDDFKSLCADTDCIVTMEMIGQTKYKQLDRNLLLVNPYKEKYAGHISVE